MPGYWKQCSWLVQSGNEGHAKVELGHYERVGSIDERAEWKTGGSKKDAENYSCELLKRMGMDLGPNSNVAAHSNQPMRLAAPCVHLMTELADIRV